jgi:hypothetical protein
MEGVIDRKSLYYERVTLALVVWNGPAFHLAALTIAKEGNFQTHICNAQGIPNVRGKECSRMNKTLSSAMICYLSNCNYGRHVNLKCQIPDFQGEGL